MKAEKPGKAGGDSNHPRGVSLWVVRGWKADDREMADDDWAQVVPEGGEGVTWHQAGWQLPNCLSCLNLMLS